MGGMDREPVRPEYRDLWLLSFADDGRMREFEEWAYWPGQPYTSSVDEPGGDPWNPRAKHG
jgi:hypothetical protein